MRSAAETQTSGLAKSLLAELSRWLVAACWVYFTLLSGWVVAYALFQDGLAYLALINNLAVYFFFPLPVVVLIAFWSRRRELWALSTAAFLVFSWLWGLLFVPRLPAQNSGQPVLRVMTYNVLGRHADTAPVIQTISLAGPDVVLLQEVNTDLAAAMSAELSGEYPHQVLDPVDGVTGMGVISRYPLKDAGLRLPLDWVGEPQVLALDWQGQTVTLVNFHMYPSGLGQPSGVDYVYRAREEQASELAAFARQAAVEAPVIAAGDANVTSLSEAYLTVSESLTDAWLQAGFGLGHTFPGSDIPGSSRPRVAGISVPRWLARIDYIFVSSQWEVVEAELAPFDGVSDHRGVVADLTLK